jgi:hypothetical protein
MAASLTYPQDVLAPQDLPAPQDVPASQRDLKRGGLNLWVCLEVSSLILDIGAQQLTCLRRNPIPTFPILHGTQETSSPFPTDDAGFEARSTRDDRNTC